MTKRLPKTLFVLICISVLLLIGCAKQVLFKAVRYGHVDTVSALVWLFPSLLKAEDRSGGTPLNMAAEFDQVDVAQVLIDAGSDLHHDSPLSGMPLQHAACSGQKRLLALLLKAGADVNRLSPRPNSQFPGTALCSAVRAENLEMTKILIDHGADVNARNNRKSKGTILQYAACGDPSNPDVAEIVKLLLAKGADVNARNADGKTALYFAKNRVGGERGQSAIVDLLVDHGAKE